ncbi:sodium channel protein Nach [Euwallacea fornicatus]|uniref:sodium channel protein Nach n=1 Tax=Euwallacea fornicatus TaxID=995702 RepID=UPI00338EB2B1
MSTWAAYQNHAVSFVVDTNYREWNTDFPAVYVCEIENEDKVAVLSDRLFGVPHDYNLDEMVKEMTFYTSHNFFTLRACGPNRSEHSDFCARDYSSHISQARSTCTELFRQCKWNNQKFECCNLFMAIQSDLGVCFAINTMQTKLQTGHRTKLSMISNSSSGLGSLHLELNGQTHVYILGRLEIPASVTSKKDYMLVETGMHIKRSFNVKEIENQPEVRDLSIQQRKCRYPEENYLEVYPYYSYSACLLQCRKSAQLSKCACAHHLMPNTAEEDRCNITGLACIQTNFKQITVQKHPGSSNVGLECNCLVSCNEIQLDVVNEDLNPLSNASSIVDISLERLPTERFKRIVVKDKMDVVVSIGSAIALFLGASFLTLAEIFVYFLMHPLSEYLTSPLLSSRFGQCT